MIRPDFRDYRNHGEELMHSAKGTTWGKHKYVAKKIINGKVRYIYAIKDAALGSKHLTKHAIKNAKEKKISELWDTYTKYQNKWAEYDKKAETAAKLYGGYSNKEYQEAKANANRYYSMMGDVYDEYSKLIKGSGSKSKITVHYGNRR